MKTLVNEYLGHNTKTPKLIYHYCSVDAFLSIINKSCIWLSDMSKTNDNTEMQWLFSHVKNSVKDVLSELKKQISVDVKLRVELFINQLVEGYLVSKNIPIAKYDKYFLTCFSEKPDLLSQWRAYANDGKGIAVGFATDYFLRFQDNESYEFVKVTYRQKDINLFLKGAFEIPLKNLLLSNEEHRDDNDLFLNIALIFNSVYQEGFIFKNPYFSEEKEWRLFRKINHSNFSKDEGVDDYGFASFLEGIFSDNTKYVGGFTRSHLKFRNTDNDLKLYMELGFSDFKKEIIQSIIVGPKCNVAELDLKLLLLEKGYIDDIESNDIKILKSVIPYI